VTVSGPDDDAPVAVGEVRTVTCTVTAEAIARFAELTGDRAPHHVAPSCGPPIAHGLLVAATASSVLSGLGYLGRRTTLEFTEPVYADDILSAEVAVVRVAHAGPLGTSVAVKLVITNHRGVVVLRGTAAGLLPRGPQPS
jgi:acyl dehydratase